MQDEMEEMKTKPGLYADCFELDNVLFYLCIMGIYLTAFKPMISQDITKL